MDRVVERRIPRARLVAYGVLALVLLAFVWWVAGQLLGGRSLSVNADRVFVSHRADGGSCSRLHCLRP